MTVHIVCSCNMTDISSLFCLLFFSYFSALSDSKLCSPTHFNTYIAACKMILSVYFLALFWKSARKCCRRKCCSVMNRLHWISMLSSILQWSELSQTLKKEKSYLVVLSNYPAGYPAEYPAPARPLASTIRLRPDLSGSGRIVKLIIRCITSRRSNVSENRRWEYWKRIYWARASASVYSSRPSIGGE